MKAQFPLQLPLVLRSEQLQRYSSQLTARIIVILLVAYILAPSVTNVLRTEFGFPLARYLDELLFLFLLSASAFNIIIHQRLVASSIYIFGGLLILSGLISTIINPVESRNVISGFLQLAKPLIILIACYNLYFDQVTGNKLLRQIDGVLSWITITAFGYLIIFDIILGINFAPSTDFITTARRFGIPLYRSYFMHPGTFANVMVICAIFHFSNFMIRRQRRSMRLLLMAIFCVLSTTRMKANILMPICLALIFFILNFQSLQISRRLLRRLSIVGVIGAVIAGSFAYVVRDELIYRIFTPNSRSVRYVLFQGALDITANNWGFGAGFGQFGSPASTINYSPLYYEYGLNLLRYATPENASYITDQWWAWYIGETGAFGFIAFLLLILFAILSLRKIALASLKEIPRTAVLAATSIGVLTYGTLIGYAGSFISGPPVSYYTMILTGVSFATYFSARQNLSLRTTHVDSAGDQNKPTTPKPAQI